MFWDFKGISVSLFHSHALHLLEKKPFSFQGWLHRSFLHHPALAHCHSSNSLSQLGQAACLLSLSQHCLQMTAVPSELQQCPGGSCHLQQFTGRTPAQVCFTALLCLFWVTLIPNGKVFLLIHHHSGITVPYITSPSCDVNPPHTPPSLNTMGVTHSGTGLLKPWAHVITAQQHSCTVLCYSRSTKMN